MAGKAINVKVSRVKIIDALQSRLAQMISDKEAYDKAEKKYEKDKADWVFKVSELALKSNKIELNADKTNVYTNGHYRTKSSKHALVEIVLDVPLNLLPPQPEEPKYPFRSEGYGRNYVGGFDDRKQEIENAIRILQLSDEEVVSTSTYQSVSRYL
jgi:hypothetical protein